MESHEANTGFSSRPCTDSPSPGQAAPTSQYQVLLPFPKFSSEEVIFPNKQLDQMISRGLFQPLPSCDPSDTISGGSALCPKHSPPIPARLRLGSGLLLWKKKANYTTLNLQLSCFGFYLYLLAGQGEQHGSCYGKAEAAPFILLP